MSKVVIKTVNRKTTVSKAAIKKAAKIAYASNGGLLTSHQADKPAKTNKAA